MSKLLNSLGILSPLIILWLSCYTFYVFPWTPPDWEWWYAPHLLTTIGVNFTSWILSTWCIKNV